MEFIALSQPKGKIYFSRSKVKNIKDLGSINTEAAFTWI